MPEKRNWSKFNLGTPAVYDIKIRGFLDEDWSKRLGGMEIQHIAAVGGITITTLQGEMLDQAALFGVLSNLYDLGFPILSVDCNPTC